MRDLGAAAVTDFLYCVSVAIRVLRAAVEDKVDRYAVAGEAAFDIVAFAVWVNASIAEFAFDIAFAADAGCALAEFFFAAFFFCAAIALFANVAMAADAGGAIAKFFFAAFFFDASIALFANVAIAAFARPAAVFAFANTFFFYATFAVFLRTSLALAEIDKSCSVTWHYARA